MTKLTREPGISPLNVVCVRLAQLRDRMEIVEDALAVQETLDAIRTDARLWRASYPYPWRAHVRHMRHARRRR